MRGTIEKITEAPGRLVRPEAQLHQLAGGCFTGRTRGPRSYDERAWLCEPELLILPDPIVANPVHTQICNSS